MYDDFNKRLRELKKDYIRNVGPVLSLRNNAPNKTDRKKLKEKRAMIRRLRAERRKQLSYNRWQTIKQRERRAHLKEKTKLKESVRECAIKFEYKSIN